MDVVKPWSRMSLLVHSHLTVLLLLWICASLIAVSSWSSSTFTANSGKFKCQSVACDANRLFRGVYNSGSKNDPDSVFFHTIVGCDHPSSFALLVHQLCEALHKCIPADHISVLLHSKHNMHAQVDNP